MSKLTLAKPEVGKPDATEDIKIVNALMAIEAWANGLIDSTNIKAQGIETIAIKLLAITTALLASEAVTEPKLSKAVQEKLAEKGTGLVLANKYTKTTYTKAEAEAGITPSGTRPAIITLVVNGEVEKTVQAYFTVGGQQAGGTKNETPPEPGRATSSPVTVWTSPGEAWKLEGGSEHVGSIAAYTKLL